MTISILATKLYIPKSRTELTPRSHLVERLEDGLTNKLMLVTAPAGYGKSTLVSHWVNLSQATIAWLSLDELDNDVSRFLRYVIAALQEIEPHIGEEALSNLQSLDQIPIETILTRVISDIIFATKSDTQSNSASLSLVLDDYHVVTTQEVHNVVQFLLDHSPPTFQFIIISRVDPPLSIARLRGQGNLLELRAADLRFTLQETQHFLNSITHLDLPNSQVVLMERRTEGWITGLQLAALAMHERKRRGESLSQFITAFTGDNRFIADYLIDEVLAQQSDMMRDFLLQTSILERFSGALCDAVTEQQGGQQMLEQLEHMNLFVVALDNKRQWYRYHRLFADLLSHRMRSAHAEHVQELHQRAALWHENNDNITEAIEYHLKAEAFELAANLIEKIGLTLIHHRDIAQLSVWLNALPEAMVRARPLLSVCHAWSLRYSGHMESIERSLQDIEDALHGDAGGVIISLSAAQVQEVQGHVAALRTYIALYDSELPRTIELAHQALEHLDEPSPIRVIIATALGYAYLRSDNLEGAQHVYAEVLASSRIIGNPVQTIVAICNLGTTQVEQGRLHKGYEIYQEAIQSSEERKQQGRHRFSIMAHAYIDTGEILYQWNKLEIALQRTLEGIELGKHGGSTETLIDATIMLTRIRQAQGAFDDADATLQKAEQLLEKNVDPARQYWVEECRVRLWLAQGHIAKALGWVQERGLTVNDEIGFIRRPEYILLAHILIIQSSKQPEISHLSDVQNLLNRILAKAETSGRMDRIIETLILQSLAFRQAGDLEAALLTLSRALSLAEPEGYIRIFIDKGTKMAQLLYDAIAQGIYSEYSSKLLTAFPDTSNANEKALQEAQAQLIEALSERELEVLNLIASGASNAEIAQTLFIAITTVKKHITNIFGKLAVSNRAKAVVRARSLGLVD